MNASDRPTATILVVDDEPAVRDSCRRLLEDQGHQVVEAASGEEALERLPGLHPELVILDLMMPGMHGIEVCRRIRLEHPRLELPVILATALSDGPSRVRGMRAGADDFLAKPVEPTELQLRVRNLLQLKRHNEAMQGHADRLEVEVQRRTGELEQAIHKLQSSEVALRQSAEDALDRLATAVEYRDDETAQHSRRVGEYSALLCRAAGHDEARCHQLRLASPLHDAGKVGMPDAILRKPGRLTEAEFDLIKTHSQIGHNILSGTRSPLIELAADVALTHHERWDGTGYPHGLAGEAIPMHGRIVAIADVFDALTNDRVYRAAMPLDDAVALMREQRGHHFDPRLLDLFLASTDRLEEVRERLPDAP